jgi:Ca-activated chloride channel family protein
MPGPFDEEPSMFAILRVVICLLFFGAAVQARADQAIIVLDASGSMWGQIAGETKMDVAKRTLATVLGTVAPALELGMMAYGHRDKGSCADIELMVPPAAGSASAIAAAAHGINPKGKTPISDAVRQAAEILRFTEEKATVILVTDGIETCEADPCAVASALEQAGVDLTVHVVGFGLTDDEGRQVACLAENTGGQYLPAGDAAMLGAALTQTVAETVAPAPPAPPAAEPQVERNLKVTSRPAPGAPPFTGADGIAYDAFVATADGHEPYAVATEYGGNGSEATFLLPAGRYVIVAKKELASAEAVVEVIATAQTTADIVFNAGVIKAQAMATPTEPATESGIAWDVTDVSGEVDTSYGSNRTILVDAGAAMVKASLGSASASVPVNVVAGQTTSVQVVIGAGKLVLKGKRSAEATDFDTAVSWDVTGASGDTATSYGEASFDLPAGDYKVVARLGEATAEISVTVSAGQTTEQVVVVATGKVIAHALFAAGGPVVTAGPRFDILAPEPGTDGNRKVLATSYEDGASFDLPPGRYVLAASSDEASAEIPFDLVAGPPVEVSVVLNAGLLALTAPGGDRLDILSSQKDIYGKQETIATSYGESWSLALPAGAYTVKVTKPDGGEKTAEAAITAGQRTEVTVE